MKTIERTAKTAEEAIELALKELDVERTEVEIDVISRGKAGILGIGGEPARVRVTLLEKPKAEEPPSVAKVAVEVLDGLIKNMGVTAVVNLRSTFREDVGGPVLEIDGDDSGLLIGRRGETLRALQFLVTFITGRRTNEKVNIFVDISGYQARRYQALENMALKVAQRVESSGRPITLEPMPPNERRVIHMALADNPRVKTASTGEGDHRQVVVEPAR
ncbi:MAG: protein jag [SAR202 cluster bacterium]|nr:protein jag [SAR202 cluster bacterium]